MDIQIRVVTGQSLCDSQGSTPERDNKLSEYRGWLYENNTTPISRLTVKLWCSQYWRNASEEDISHLWENYSTHQVAIY